VGDITAYSDALAKVFFQTGINMELLVVLRKTRDGPFRIPYNGKYLDTNLLSDSYRSQYGSLQIYEQFFPGARTTRADSSTDINLIPSRALAKALLKRIGRKLLHV
jgi:hypothetical protein